MEREFTSQRLRRKSGNGNREANSKTRRDWLDKATLFTAAIGAVVVVVSTVLTQRDSADSDKRAAASLAVLTDQARTGAIQAEAATRMAGVTEQQLANVKDQLSEMKSQSEALSMTANAANKQIQGINSQIGEMRSQSNALGVSAEAANQQLKLAVKHNMIVVTPVAGFDRRFAVGKEGGVFIYNSGTGPARINNLKAYLDGNLIEISDLQNVDPNMFNGVRPFWSAPNSTHTIPQGKEYAVFYTDATNVNDWARFEELVRNRMWMISRSCSLYDECSYICLVPSREDLVKNLPEEFKNCP